MLDPLSRPKLQLPALLKALRRHRVDWVLSGSTVLAAYGAEVTPNDLDVVPEPGIDNLRRLAALLVELHAVPAYFPDWKGGPSEETCRAWRPRPLTLEQLDHLYVTTLGMVDVPPDITGTYEQLRAGATELTLAGEAVWACDPEEVLRRLPAKPRAKDVERAATYAALRERLKGRPS